MTRKYFEKEIQNTVQLQKKIFSISPRSLDSSADSRKSLQVSQQGRGKKAVVF